MADKDGPRWPWEPVETQLRLRGECGVRVEQSLAGRRWRADLTVVEMAEVLGVNQRQVYRWRRRGLDCWAADLVAVRLGLHPVLVWPEWLDVYGTVEVAA